MVDASGMAVRVHAEKAVSRRGRAGVAGAYGKCWAQKRQVRTYFCLERAGNHGENVEKCRIPGARTAIKRGENVEKGRITEVSRRNEREDGHGRMTEHEGGEQKQKKQQQKKKKKTKKKNKNIMMMMMMMMRMMMMMMMMMMMTMTMTMIAETMMMVNEANACQC